MSAKKYITAEEVLKKLHSDPKWVEATAKADADHAERTKELRAAEAPLAKELRQLSYDVETAWDLMTLGKPYPNAIPVLFEHLQKDYSDPIRDGIARSLGVPEAKPYLQGLIKLYAKEPSLIGNTNSRAKDGMANAISQIAGAKDIEALISLALDKSQGSSRVFFIRPLGRSKSPEAIEALNKLRDDPEVHDEVEIVLGALKTNNK